MNDRPWSTWYSVTSNQDSEWWQYFPHPANVASWNYATQTARGAGYASDFDKYWNTCNSNTAVCSWVGIEFWAYKSFSFWERVNFGLLSWRDNAYDGHENVKDSVQCSSPISQFRCGGEVYDWKSGSDGDFLGRVTKANKTTDRLVAGAAPSAARGTQH